MNNNVPTLTPTDIIVTSTNTLQTGGYKRIDNGFPEWNTLTTRLFENEYNIVGLAVFATCSELLQSWANLQGLLVDLISRNVGSTENKAWDGYLVLLTVGIAPSGDLDIDEIRHDTTRLRKLVATGDDLSTAGDVERLLRPLLPLTPSEFQISAHSSLDILPALLEAKGINRATMQTIIQAFKDQKPLMDALHQKGSF